MPYRKHLATDKKLFAIASDEEPFLLEKRTQLHLQLCKSIISQQLSTRVAAIINQRFLALVGKKNPKPSEIADLSYDDLRSIGLSHAKATYVHNVAAFWEAHKLTDKKLHAMPNDELISLLTGIKGIGRWTTEMLLMFSMGREDVFSSGDLGIQQAMMKVYNLDGTDKKLLIAQMEKLAEKWSPYRSYACLRLWSYKDNPPEM